MLPSRGALSYQLPSGTKQPTLPLRLTSPRLSRTGLLRLPRPMIIHPPRPMLQPEFQRHMLKLPSTMERGDSCICRFCGVKLNSTHSAYSPIPSFPEDRGPDEPIDASITSGAPLDLQSRTVRIYKPTKAATQSGHWNGRQWRMDWDVLPRGHRWENQLMGWQSSGDFMQGTHIFFNSKEDAIHFAEKQGM